MSDEHIEPELTIDIDLSADDFRRTLIWFHKTKLIFAGILFVVFILLGLASVAVVLSLQAKTKNVSVFSALPSFVPALLTGFALLAYVFAIQKAAKLAFNGVEPSRLSLSPSGVEMISRTTSVHSLWSKFKRVAETKTDFIIFPSETAFYPVPKRFFNNEVEIKEFRRILRTNMTGKLNLYAD